MERLYNLPVVRELLRRRTGLELSHWALEPMSLPPVKKGLTLLAVTTHIIRTMWWRVFSI